MTQAAELARFAAAVPPGGALLPTGTIIQALFTAVPAGWLKLNGTSIGNASSGATGRANADTAALFAVVWNNMAQADATVQNSSGNTVSRGASATADFAANRRIVLPDMRGEFSRGLDESRGVDSGRAMGSAQAQAIQAHTHTYNDAMNGTVAGNVNGSGTQGTTGATSGSTGGTETRPRNRAFPFFIKL